jgi:hypothetical protein
MLIAIRRQKRRTNDGGVFLDSERAITDASDALSGCCLYSDSDSPATLVYSGVSLQSCKLKFSAVLFLLAVFEPCVFYILKYNVDVFVSV